MAALEPILANYQMPRLLMQNMHVPANPYGGPNFLYMKNHKAACTNVISLLITQMHHALGSDKTLKFSMDHMHKRLTTDYLLAGAKVLSWPVVEDALFSPDWYRFTIVRNPLSRTVSAWADKLQDDTRQRRDLNKALGRDLETEISLTAFLDVIAQDEKARLVDRHWRPQTMEISYDHVRYDFIGRVEAMKAARAHIIAALFGPKGEAVQEVDTRERLGHKSSSRDYLEALSAKDRRPFETAYARDFEMYDAVLASETAS